MKKKIFHDDEQLDGTARVVVDATCTECEEHIGEVVEFTAELNVGEHYTVRICYYCLLQSAMLIEDR